MTTNKPGILFLHGYPLDNRVWSEQLGFLDGHFFLFRPNFPGFGETGPAETNVYAIDGSSPIYISLEFTDWTSLAGLSDWLANAIDQLHDMLPTVPDKWIVCGLSMGGYVALEFWKRHRHRVAGLVLTNTKASIDDDKAIANRLAVVEQAKSLGSDSVTLPMLPKLLAQSSMEKNPKVVARVEAMMRSISSTTISRSQQAMIFRDSFMDDLGVIDVPTLVLAGARDVITPGSLMESMAAKIPQSYFKVIEDAGHLAPMENPADWNSEFLSFLAKL